MIDNKSSATGNIIVENRKKINVTGVNECIGFDEETILLDTQLGKLTIKGIGLHIKEFNTSTGELIADGKIHALAYSINNTKQSFFSKIFR